MGIPIPFKEANHILQRPVTLTAEECKSVECFIDKNECITRWQLTDEELAELKRNGGKVYLRVIGIMSPSLVQVESPFKESP